MNYEFNRKNLKALMNIQVDAQYCHQAGLKLFNYVGELNKEYKDAALYFKTLLFSLDKEVKFLMQNLEELERIEKTERKDND